MTTALRRDRLVRGATSLSSPSVLEFDPPFSNLNVVASYSRVMQNRYYEITDHLGNSLSQRQRGIRLVVTDLKLGQDTVSGIVGYYFAEEVQAREALRVLGAVRASQRWAMVGRQWSSVNYRYGFNGMEEDDEMKGEGMSYDFGARVYDPRVGRWWSRDPMEGKFTYVSTYGYSLNSPIILSDKDGKEPEVPTVKISLAIVVTNSYRTCGMVTQQGDWTVITVQSLTDFADAIRSACIWDELSSGKLSIDNLWIDSHGGMEPPSINIGEKDLMFQEKLKSQNNQALYAEDFQGFLQKGEAITASKTRTLNVLGTLGSFCSPDAKIGFAACAAGRTCIENPLPQLVFDFFSQSSGSNGLSLYMSTDYTVAPSITPPGYQDGVEVFESEWSPAFNENMIPREYLYNGFIRVDNAGVSNVCNLYLGEQSGRIMEVSCEDQARMYEMNCGQNPACEESMMTNTR